MGKMSGLQTFEDESLDSDSQGTSGDIEFVNPVQEIAFESEISEQSATGPISERRRSVDPEVMAVFDRDDEEEQRPEAPCFERCGAACARGSRLKKVPGESHGIDKTHVTCCNPKGTSHNVYTINGDVHMAKLSCGMDSEHKFRRGVFRIVHSSYIETFVFICVLVQTVCLATSIPGTYMDFEALQPTFAAINHFLLGVYSIEMVARIIALGFIRSRHAYLRSAWNLLDCFLVVSAWIFLILELFFNTDVINPSVLRVIRCLRPLRTAGFIAPVKAALGYWPYLLNVSILLVFTLSLFGVLGIQLFGGALSLECVDQRDISELQGDTISAATIADFNLINNSTFLMCPEALFCDSTVCDFITDHPVPRWGFDNIAQALITGWVAATGDLWTVGTGRLRTGMMSEITAMPLRYPQTAWWFFTFLFLVLNMVPSPHPRFPPDLTCSSAPPVVSLVMPFRYQVASNLYVAVVVDSFIQSSKEDNDAGALKDKLMKLVSIFNRLDTNRTGSIGTEELRTLVNNLGLDDTETRKSRLSGTLSFSEAEILAAMKELDKNGDNRVRPSPPHVFVPLQPIQYVERSPFCSLMYQVDFEEFKSYWDSNSSFVIKLKKGLKLQEDDIREVWVRIDQDASESLNKDELKAMGSVLGIDLTDMDMKTMLEEMGARENEIPYNSFVAWWLSDSKVSDKVREAKKQDQGTGRLPRISVVCL
jgi:Ca2+-binding EF-hand superfamily protein